MSREYLQAPASAYSHEYLRVRVAVLEAKNSWARVRVICECTHVMPYIAVTQNGDPYLYSLKISPVPSQICKSCMETTPAGPELP